MKNSKLKIMVFAAMYAALAIVLDYVKVIIPFTSLWTNGGTIDIALIPLVFASFHLGWKNGLITALVQFIASIAIGATHLYIAYNNATLGFLCDYVFPQAIIAFASVFMVSKAKEFNFENLLLMEAGIVLTMTIRILCQVISGAYCWMEEGVMAGSSAAWSFSIGYNLTYGIPTLIVLAIVIPLLYKMFVKKIG